MHSWIDAELELEEKYRDTLHTVEALRDQMVVRRDLTMRANAGKFVSAFSSF